MPFMESLTRVCVLSPPKLLLALWISVLLSTVSVRGNYEFTIRFYEFRNPLGLQCGDCGNGGPPACCDEEGNGNCRNNAPYNCDTRFRFTLRPFRASIDSAPSGNFPHFTPSNGNNSDIFNEGPGGFLALTNPFTITDAKEWTGRVQFFIDALDSDVRSGEIELFINRFPIDLELELGAAFTERTTYTGIYNISGLGFDMSFRVQCSENYYGPNCTTFCEPLKDVYNCNSEGRPTCILANRDPTTNCTTCLPGWGPKEDCDTCLPFYDAKSNCAQCLTGWNISTECTMCLSGYDPLSNCTECLPGSQCQPTSTATTTSGVAPTSSSSSSSIAVVGGAVGGAAVLIILLLVLLCVVIVIMTLQLRRQRRKFTVAGTISGLNNAYLSRDSSVKETTETTRPGGGGEHDFENPLYDASKQNGSQWETDNSAYSKLQRPPVQKSFVPPKFPYNVEKTEEISYQLDVAGKGADDTMNSNEQPAYDIAYPPPPPPSFNEMGGAYDVTNHPNHQFLGASPSALAGGIYDLANYPEQSVYDDANLPPKGSSNRLPRNDYADVTDVPGTTVTASQVPQHDYADIPDPQNSSKAAAAPQYDYADTALFSSSLPPSAPMAPGNDPSAEHEYAVTDDVINGPHDTPSEPPSVAYANTTPGLVTQEAMGHYDLGH